MHRKRRGWIREASPAGSALRRGVGAAALLLSLGAAEGVTFPEGRIPFRSYGAEQGLDNSAATRVAQDAVGFVWVGTADGIFRYDGRRFVRFGLREGLPSTAIASIVPTRDGGLWVVTARGAARWDGVAFHVPAPLAAAGAVNDVGIDEYGAVWLARPDGLYRLTGERLEREAGWAGEATAVWGEPGSGRILAAGPGRVGVRSAGGEWSVSGPESGLLEERIDAVLTDRAGRTWARSGPHLWGREREATTFEDLSARLPWTSSTGYLARDRAGNVWIPTDRGIATFDGTRWRVIGAREGLPTQWARDVMEDREGSLWVASIGVHRMLGRGALVSYTRESGLPEDVTWCFLVDRKGRLLVGTDQGLARARSDGWEVVPGVERNAVRSLVEEPDGTLWSAGSPMEILRIDPSGGVRRFGAAQGVKGKSVLHLARGRDGAIWAATNGGGLLRRPAGGERFTREELPGGGAGERIGSVLEDRSGRIWAAGEAGLACRSGGRWQRFTTGEGLARDHISYVLETASGELLASYFEPIGIARLAVAGNPGALRIRVAGHLENDGDGRPLGKVYLLGEDARRRLWVGTGRGVFVFDGKEVRHYGTGEGLAGDDTDAMAFLADPDGNVWVGTSAGFSRLAPPESAALPEPPVPVLLGASLGPVPVPLVPGALPTKPVEVSHGRNDLSVSFAGLSFRNESQVENAYRLSGSDDDWKLTTEGSVTYRALPPGRYRFELRSRLRGGPWSGVIALPFTIRPSRWQSPLSVALAALGGLLLVAGAVRWRTLLLLRRNVQLERVVQERTRALARANESLEALSVTDSLTGLHNRRYLHRCMPEYAADALRWYAGLARERKPLVRTNGDLVFLMIDLDRFKRINDEHGHLAGDHVLVEFGARVKRTMRDSDVLVRWGGEEFLMIARGTSREDAPLLASRLFAALRARPFPLPDGSACDVSCSIGFAPFPFFTGIRERLRWEEVVDLADAALLFAKRTGRARWVGYLPGPAFVPDDVSERLRTDLEEAVASGILQRVASRE